MAVAYTDSDLVVTSMPEYRVAQQTLQGAYQKSQQAVQNMTVGYQQKVDTYQQQQAMLTPDRRTAQEAELMQLQQEIQTMAAQQEQQLKDQELDLMIPIQEKVQVAINEIAVARGLDPEYYLYPSFFFYFLFAVMGGLYVFGWIHGGYENV
ncbi:MAG TPA: hypothetical protein DIT99_06625, partial [Candidatus Latescibacteria bacterium]|nr:hypothetical protein [Candidatus Latescibacterota bacterium]